MVIMFCGLNFEQERIPGKLPRGLLKNDRRVISTLLAHIQGEESFAIEARSGLDAVTGYWDIVTLL